MTVEIACPLCGRRQIVERWVWEFSRHEQEIEWCRTACEAAGVAWV